MRVNNIGQTAFGVKDVIVAIDPKTHPNEHNVITSLVEENRQKLLEFDEIGSGDAYLVIGIKKINLRSAL